MKTKSLFRYALRYAIYSFVFFWTAFSSYAQCPTIIDETPPPICDASGFTINDLNAFAIDTGDGIVWYNVLSGGTPLNVSQLVSEGTYYVDNISGTCGTRPFITISFEAVALCFLEFKTLSSSIKISDLYETSRLK